MLQAQQPPRNENQSQKTEKQLITKNEKEEGEEDVAYELKHKSMPWFQKMNQPNAN